MLHLEPLVFPMNNKNIENFFKYKTSAFILFDAEKDSERMKHYREAINK